jgi:anti-sigma B factor antagonist
LATSLTRDEHLVLQHLLSGKDSEEIAAILDLPLQMVRTCVHTLITWVLDEMEPNQGRPAPPSVGMPNAASVDMEKSTASPPFAQTTRTQGAQQPAPEPHRVPGGRPPRHVGATRERRLSRSAGAGVGAMTVHVVEIDDGLLVDGELDMDATDDFLEIAEARVDGTREVVLDIADLGFIDSAGVRAILQLAATSCPNGMVLHRPREGVQRVLDIRKIEEVPGIRVQRHDA